MSYVIICFQAFWNIVPVFVEMLAILHVLWKYITIFMIFWNKLTHYIVFGYYIQNHVQNSPKIHIEEVVSSKFLQSKVSELLKLKEGPPTVTEVPLLHPIASDRKLLFNQLNFPAHDSCDVSWLKLLLEVLTRRIYGFHVTFHLYNPPSSSGCSNLRIWTLELHAFFAFLFTLSTAKRATQPCGRFWALPKPAKSSWQLRGCADVENRCHQTFKNVDTPWMPKGWCLRRSSNWAAVQNPLWLHSIRLIEWFTGIIYIYILA